LVSVETTCNTTWWLYLFPPGHLVTVLALICWGGLRESWTEVYKCGTVDHLSVIITGAGRLSPRLKETSLTLRRDKLGQWWGVAEREEHDRDWPILR